MESIEEIAKEILHQTTAIDLWNAEEVEKKLVKMATEQRRIDIEKACDAYCKLHCNADTRWMCRNNPISRCTTFEVFKKALEE